MSSNTTGGLGGKTKRKRKSMPSGVMPGSRYTQRQPGGLERTMISDSHLPKCSIRVTKGHATYDNQWRQLDGVQL